MYFWKFYVSKTFQPPVKIIEVARLQQIQGWDLLFLQYHVQNYNSTADSDLG